MTKRSGQQADPGPVARNIQELRASRRMTQTVLAGLVGVDQAVISRLENGKQGISSRKQLEGIAWALRVAPHDLTSETWKFDDPVLSRADGTVLSIEAAFNRYQLGEDPEVPVREWPLIARDIRRLVHLMHVTSDYAAQGEMVPALLGELHGAYLHLPEQREGTLLGLIHCYSSACWVSKRLGGRGLPLMAAQLAQQAAAELESPQWQGYTTWQRGAATGRTDRALQLTRAVAAADELTPHLDDVEVIQAYGMLHLSAALAAATQGDASTADTHLDEAEQAADRMDDDTGDFGRMWFGKANVGVWRGTIAAELGDRDQIQTLAKTVPIATIPSPSRQAEWFGEVGRVLLGRARTAPEGEHLLMRAFDLAPQRVKADVFIREAVGQRMRAQRASAGSKDLRFLAHQLGVGHAS